MSGYRREAAPLRRRTLTILVVATVIGSAGLAAGGTAGALLGVEITGTEAAAGLPLGLLVVGQAVAFAWRPTGRPDADTAATLHRIRRGECRSGTTRLNIWCVLKRGV